MQNHHLSEWARREAIARWNAVAKPLHSLGRLEDMIVQIAGIQETADVRLSPRCVLVFCGDHGVVAEGVSQSGQEVTALVARSIAEGSANVNLMAAVSHADVYAVDMGMAQDVPGMIMRKRAYGTQNMTKAPAMTRAQAQAAVQAGMDLVGEMKEKGYRLIAAGEMGIGNTTVSTAMACALLGLSPQALAGRGAGLCDAGLARKIKAIERALTHSAPDSRDPMDILAKVGGYEIAGMAGAFLGGMQHRVPVVVDGVISAVAALLAVRLCPRARDFMLPSHMSREPAMLRIMQELALEPVIHADMALGEGTGAAALFPMLDMAHRVYAGTHTFDDLGMQAYTPQEGRA
ncbi:MAG: nicotinate-nucleotide--dimethylbenzimidazole phosphoribosyltransferase [Clostridia bacterium]|nr:nicotinate-nucleotide--dimethylbenzimidazole phosphoribosyltransferase [Clostridia bacterium]